MYNGCVPLIVLVALWCAAYWLVRVARLRGRQTWFQPQDVAAWGLLALAAAGFFWRLLAGDAYMPADGGDMASFLFPLYRFVQANLRRGVFPLWNPYLYGGAPFIGEIQAGLFYPVNWAVWLLGPTVSYRSLEMLSIFHIWWAGAGMYLYLRGRVRGMAALVGAIAFMFSDLFLTHFGNLNLIAVAAWLPWVFWAYERALARQGMRWAVVGGALLGIATLAGHLQVTIFIGLALTIYTVLHALTSGRSLLTVSRPFFLTAVVALGLSAVVLLPAWEMAQHTPRAAWDYGQTVSFSLSPAQWIGLLVPGFFGRGPQFHWGLWPRVEVGYMGILPLVLATLALTMRQEKREWALAGLALAALSFALGVYSVPHGWLTALVPGLGQLRAPARFMFVFNFALAALAASGLEALVGAWGARERAGFALAWRACKGLALFAWGVAVPLAYLALLLGQDRDPTVFARLSVALISVVFFAAFLTLSLLLLAARRLGWAKAETLGALALLLTFVDLASSGAYNDLSPQDPARGFSAHGGLVAFLQAQPGPFRIDTRTDIDRLWQPSAALVYGLEDVSGVANPLTLAAPARYWEGMGSRSSPLYDFLNVGFVVARKDVVLDWSKFELAYDGDAELNVYRNRRALPRAFLVHQAVKVADAEAAWAAIHAPGFDPTTKVVVEGGRSLAGAEGEGDEVVFLSRGLNDMTLAVHASGPGYLVLSEVYYPGWRAEVNGQPAPVLRANYAFRAVEIPDAGLYRIRLRYAPPSFLAGAALSAMTALCLAGGGAWLLARGGVFVDFLAGQEHNGATFHERSKEILHGR
jgi:hypothetical protein